MSSSTRFGTKCALFNLKATICTNVHGHTMVYSMRPTHRALHKLTGYGQATSEQTEGVQRWSLESGRVFATTPPPLPCETTTLWQSAQCSPHEGEPEARASNAAAREVHEEAAPKR